jgi:putative DNA primase/helicase
VSKPFSAREIAAAFGGNVTGPSSANIPGPGHSRNDRSLSVKIDPRAPGGFVVYSHAGDNPIECRDYICARLGFLTSRGGERQQPLVVAECGDVDEAKRKAVALKIWKVATDPIGSIVERYLRDHRGLELPAGIAGNAIRFHPSLRFNQQTDLPAMVCLLRNIITNSPCGIHRTFLDPASAQKIGRKMLGVAKGAAIKFDAEPGQTLTVGEGIETVLSARAAGYAPCWALGSSGAVRSFTVINVLAELTILEENDPTSRRDVKICAKRYLDARKPVNIITSKVGNDFNDAWRAMK